MLTARLVYTKYTVFDSDWTQMDRSPGLAGTWQYANRMKLRDLLAAGKGFEALPWSEVVAEYITEL